MTASSVVRMMMSKQIEIGDRVRLSLGGAASGGGLSGRKGKVVSAVCGLYRVITDDGLWPVDGYFSPSDMKRIEDVKAED